VENLWREERTMLRVTVDQRQCVGNGCCVDIAPEVFTVGGDGVAYVCEGERVLPRDAWAVVPEYLEDAVLEVVDMCPVECVHAARAA
jgi:ferredoxin